MASTLQLSLKWLGFTRIAKATCIENSQAFIGRTLNVPIAQTGITRIATATKDTAATIAVLLCVVKGHIEPAVAQRRLMAAVRSVFQVGQALILKTFNVPIAQMGITRIVTPIQDTAATTAVLLRVVEGNIEPAVVHPRVMVPRVVFQVGQVLIRRTFNVPIAQLAITKMITVIQSTAATTTVAQEFVMQARTA